jgi:hypothetical protein
MGAARRISSRTNLKAANFLNRSESRDGAASDALSASDSGADANGDDPRLAVLPEIVAPEPLAMDTHKYRLPDHTNGNGVKVQRETREEHLARDTRPPQSDDVPPPPPAKDTPPLTSPSDAHRGEAFKPDLDSYFNPLLQRPGSIYTLSRASFTNQLAQLTSLQLPDAESLSSKVSAIPTAQAATRALIGAAEQIRGWIYKATEVIGGLESEDDVEWAAAGGREGVEEVENAIVRFEELINVYVGAIEELQSRPDIANVSAHDLKRAVAQMEAIMTEWTSVRTTLHSVKGQVEIAMEWEELWNNVLGDIQNEMDELIRLVFEMEEKRHQSILAVTNGDGVDIGDLETIVEETPPAAARLRAGKLNNRFSLPAFPTSPSSPSPGSAPAMSQDDSSLLALFARMQPLRASLDFLPMRLSVFEARADRIFPTACEELEMRRDGLDANYKKLEKDAESLRRELGEDRWVLVFRGAGRQALKMYESVEKSVSRLKEAIDTGMHLTNQPMMAKKLENYEAKKTHYGPAIERVLGIIDKGVKDRLTVNGEILRLHAEMQAKWEELKQRMVEMDATLDDLQQDKQSQQLRDSISSMLSNDRSTVASGHETPGSSPPSSVIMQMGLPRPGSAIAGTKQRAASGSQLPQPNMRRLSSLPTPAGQTISRKPVASRMSTIGAPSRDREGSATPTATRAVPRPSSVLNNRPRWNGGFTNTSDVDTGHNFKPLSLTTPSPYAKTPITPATVRSVSALTPASSSKLPTRSPLNRASSASPMPPEISAPVSNERLRSFRERLAATSPHRQPAVSTSSRPPAAPRLASASSMSALKNNNRRASFQPQPHRTMEESPDTTPRPASSMAGTRPGSSLAAPGNPRRTSLLPQPKSRQSSGGVVAGRLSPQAVAGARVAMAARAGSSLSSSGGTAEGREGRKDGRPRWR